MNQFAGFYRVERSAARAAAFLRGIELGAETILGRTGVRAEWMEQDGPAMPFGEKKNTIGNHGFSVADFHTERSAYTDTIYRAPFFYVSLEYLMTVNGLY